MSHLSVCMLVISYIVNRRCRKFISCFERLVTGLAVWRIGRKSGVVFTSLSLPPVPLGLITKLLERLFEVILSLVFESGSC